jgi:tRNA(Ile)-lysidine synthase
MERASTDSELLAAVHATIDERRLFPPSGVIVVGVSGGPDSTCLLHVLKRLCSPESPYARIRLHVAHLDHGLRGEAGRADAEFVADLAAQWGLPCTLGQEDVPALAQKDHLSLEDAARRARYAFLRRVAAEVGAARIAVGHHADDQVETLVMHWLRGSGLAGLAGMRALDGDVIRPLLLTSRTAILRYCEQHQLVYREDASNQDRSFLRNRIRHDLLPVLERYNPNLRETLLRNAAVLAEEDVYIQAQVDAAWPGVIMCAAEGYVEGDREAYRRLPLALRRRLLGRVALLVSGGKVHLELRHVVMSDALLLSAAGSGVLHLPGGLRLRRVYGRFVVASETHALDQTKRQTRDGLSALERSAQNKAVVPLPVPGEARLPGTHWLVRAHVLEGQSSPPPGYEPGEAGRRWGYLDLDVVEARGPLFLRVRHPGDRFRALGMRVEKKLQDVLVNAKVPHAERDALPLVCGADDTILWVAGYQIADLVKLTSTTRRVLVLELETIEEASSRG